MQSFCIYGQSECKRTNEVEPVLRLAATIADEHLATDVLEDSWSLLEVHKEQTLELRLGAQELVGRRALAHTHELAYHRLGYIIYMHNPIEPHALTSDYETRGKAR